VATSSARSVDEYLSELPADRREALSALRELILKHLPRGYEEEMQFGMIGYQVPLSRYPNTYNGKPLGVIALASQKQYMALYLMTVYGDAAKERRLAEAFRRAGKTLDMGKSCVRFQSLDALPLPAIAELVAGTSVDEFVAMHEANRAASAKPDSRTPPASRGKTVAKKAAAAKTAKTAKVAKKTQRRM